MKKMLKVLARLLLWAVSIAAVLGILVYLKSSGIDVIQIILDKVEEVIIR